MRKCGSRKKRWQMFMLREEKQKICNVGILKSPHLHTIGISRARPWWRKKIVSQAKLFPNQGWVRGFFIHLIFHVVIFVEVFPHNWHYHTIKFKIYVPSPILTAVSVVFLCDSQCHHTMHFYHRRPDSIECHTAKLRTYTTRSWDWPEQTHHWKHMHHA